MSQKVSTYTSLVLIIVFGFWYTYEINSAVKHSSSTTIGPQYFPNLLFGVLVVLCIWSFIKTIKKVDSQIKMPPVKLLAATMGLVVVFVWSWSTFGWVYIHSFLFLTILLLLYSQKKPSLKTLFVNVFIALISTIFLFVLFSLIINVNF